MLRTKIGKSSRLFIFILVIQDHIESIGKPILLKADEVLLNGLVAQVLSDIAPKPSTTFPLQIYPNLKVKLGPTDLIYPVPSSSVDIATARNPRQFGLTDMDLSFGLTEMSDRSHRVRNANSLFPFITFRSYRNERSVPPSLPDQLSVCLLQKSSYRVYVIGLTEIMLCPNPNEIGPIELIISVPPKSLTFTF